MSYFTAEEIAIELKIPVRTARRLIRRDMEYVLVGRQLRVEPKDFLSWRNSKKHNARMTDAVRLPAEFGAAKREAGNDSLFDI